MWAALTEPGQLCEWAPFIADRDLGSTGPAVLTMLDGESSEDVPASVTCAEPPTLLEYFWGDDLLRWELAATDSGTRLTLHPTLEDRDAAPMVAAGWHICLDVADLWLVGEPVGAIRGQEARAFGWDDLRDLYDARLAGPG